MGGRPAPLGVVVVVVAVGSAHGQQPESPPGRRCMPSGEGMEDADGGGGEADGDGVGGSGGDDDDVVVVFESEEVCPKWSRGCRRNGWTLLASGDQHCTVDLVVVMSHPQLSMVCALRVSGHWSRPSMYTQAWRLLANPARTALLVYYFYPAHGAPSSRPRIPWE